MINHRIRPVSAILILALVVVACGSNESTSSVDRDRNVDAGAGVSSTQFGVNGNGVAVNALDDRVSTSITDYRTVTLGENSDSPTVFVGITLTTEPFGAGEAVDLRRNEYFLARIDATGTLGFNDQYGLKKLATTVTPTPYDRFVLTENGYAIHVINPNDESIVRPTLVRYRLDNRQVDSAFGTRGSLKMPAIPNGNKARTTIIDVADQWDGKVLALVETNERFYVVRMNTNGQLDESFATGGIVALTSPSEAFRLRDFSRLLVDVSIKGNIEYSIPGDSIIAVVGTAQEVGRADESRPLFLVDVRIDESGIVNTDRLLSQVRGGPISALEDGSRIVDASFDRSGETSRELKSTWRPGSRNPIRVNVENLEMLYGILYRWSSSHMIGSDTSSYPFVSYRPQPVGFDDRTNAFAPDERKLGEFKQFSTLYGLYNIGIVYNRSSNFMGLAVGRHSYDVFDLHDVLRVADYPTGSTLVTSMRTSADDSIGFTVTGLANGAGVAGAMQEANDIGLVQSNVGVAMTGNGAAIPGFGGDKIWAKNPITIDYLSSYFAEDNPERLGRSFTVIGDDKNLYVISTAGDGSDPQIIKVSPDGEKSEPVTLKWKEWFLWGLPASPDGMVVRDGYLYIAGDFTSYEAGPWPLMAGVARYSLSDGQIDKTYGVQGVYPAGLGGSVPRNRILVLHEDDSFDLVNQLVTNNGRAVRVWPSPEEIPDAERGSWPQDWNLSQFELIDDVYTAGTFEGPVGVTTDKDGRVTVSRVRRSEDPGSLEQQFTLRLWRYLANGQPDESFGLGGTVEVDAFGWSQVVPSFQQPPQVTVTRENKLLVGLIGTEILTNEDNARIGLRDVHVLARFLEKGAIDALTPPEPTPIPAALIDPNPQAGGPVARLIDSGSAPALSAPAARAEVAVVEKLDPAPVTIPDDPKRSTDATSVSAPRQLKIVAMTNAVDRSIGVKWAIPESLANKNVTYEVRAEPGGKVCRTSSTLCVFRGLEAWTPYTFTVAVKSGADSVLPSDASTPTKPLRILARNKTVKTSSLVTPASKTKVTWKVTGKCALSKDNATLTTPKDATVCTLSVKSSKSGKIAAATRTVTIDVRAIVK